MIEIEQDIQDFYRGEIIDVHNHLFTPAMLDLMKADMDEKRYQKFSDTFNVPEFRDGRAAESDQDYLDNLSDSWVKKLDDNGVNKIVWFPFKGFHEAIYHILSRHPNRIVGFIWFDMQDPQASLEILKDAVKHHGIRGVKINPSADHVHPHEKSMYPAYEFMEKHGLTVLSHYGISMAPTTDVAYINPFGIQLAARDYPGINFIIAHMGAGFVRESLFLMYHDINQNIHFDCSGSGSWIKYLPYDTTFEQVYRRFLDAGGVERLLFGTDSNIRGYRTEILKQNLQIFKNMELSDKQVRKIMAGNARRVLHLRP